MNLEEEYVANNVLPYLPEKGQKERFLEVYPKIAAVMGEKRTRRILEISDYDILKSEMAAVKREMEILVFQFTGLLRALWLQRREGDKLR
jgi:hypothetical protein